MELNLLSQKALVIKHQQTKKDSQPRNAKCYLVYRN